MIKHLFCETCHQGQVATGTIIEVVRMQREFKRQHQHSPKKEGLIAKILRWFR